MSSKGDSNSEATDTDFRDCFAPWRDAFGMRILTCSPIRKGVAICMDINCMEHDVKGGKPGAHWRTSKASPLELVVINSFTGIDPKEMTGSNEFVGWTQTELHFACYGTDFVEEAQKRLFDNKAMNEKLKMYVSTFEGAAEVHRKSEEILREDNAAAVLNCVRMWSGAMNPLLFLWMMKGRNDKMVSKIARLKNTFNIWKEEADQAKRETAQLKFKLKMLKKTGETK